MLLIARGQVVAQGNVHEIRDLLEEHPHHVRVQCDRARELAARVLSAGDHVVSVSFPAPDVAELLTHDPDRTYGAVAREALASGIEVRALTSPDATLEALFHYLVERSGKMAGTGSDAALGGKHAPAAGGYKAALSAGEGQKAAAHAPAAGGYKAALSAGEGQKAPASSEGSKTAALAPSEGLEAAALAPSEGSKTAAPAQEKST